MSDQIHDYDSENESPDAQNGAEEGEASALTPLEAAEQRLAELEQDNAAMKDQLLRTLAEMENLRRRTEKEVKDARQYSVTSFARDMLGVADNLRRGLEAISPEDRVHAEGALKTLLEGTAMTERDMLQALDKHGVKKIDPQGEKFDPNFHQAMFEVPDPSVPNNSVVQVMQAGYVIEGRVLRPAMVGVSKGGPKFAPTPEEEADAQAQETNMNGGSDNPSFDQTV